MSQRNQDPLKGSHSDWSLGIGPTRVTLNGRDLNLPPQLRCVLAVLACPPGQSVSGRELEERGGNAVGLGGAHFRNVIKKLRKALDDLIPGGAAIIQTLRGQGYVLTLEEHQVFLSDAPPRPRSTINFSRRWPHQAGLLTSDGWELTVSLGLQIDPPLPPIKSRDVEWEVNVHGRQVRVQLVPPRYFWWLYPKGTWVQPFLHGIDIECQLTLSNASDLEPALFAVESRIRALILTLAKPLLVRGES